MMIRDRTGLYLESTERWITCYNVETELTAVELKSIATRSYWFRVWLRFLGRPRPFM